MVFILHGHGPPFIVPEKKYEEAEHCDDNAVASVDLHGIFGIKYRTFWVEVIDAASPPVVLTFASLSFKLLMIVMAGCIEEEVQRPGQQLTSDQSRRRNNRSLLALF